MRNLRASLTLLSLLAAFAVEAPNLHAQKQRKIRVLTWNIHHAANSEGKIDLLRIAEVIKAQKPDLVALQEVDRGVRRTGGMDQPALLAKALGMHVAFERNIKYQGGDYGNAILSRFPIQSVKNHALPKVYKDERRGALETQILIPNPNPKNKPQEIRFFSTHFDSRHDSKERPLSAHLLARTSAKIKRSLPIFIAGDFNARPKDATYRALEKTWTRPTKKELPTYPALKPVRQIDDILFRTNPKLRVLEVKVIEEPKASDHRPYLVVFTLKFP